MKRAGFPRILPCFPAAPKPDRRWPRSGGPKAVALVRAGAQRVELSLATHGNGQRCRGFLNCLLEGLLKLGVTAALARACAAGGRIHTCCTVFHVNLLNEYRAADKAAPIQQSGIYSFCPESP